MLHARSSLRRCWTLWLHWYQPNNGILVFLRLPTCSLLPPSIQVSEQDLQSFTQHFRFPPTHTVLLSFNLSMPSPMGWVSIFSKTKEMPAVTEKEDRQLDGHGLQIVLHLFSHGTVCTSFALCPHFSLSLSPHRFLSFDIFTFFSFLLHSRFSFHFCYHFHLVLRIQSAANLISHPTSHCFCLVLSLSFSLCRFFFMFVSACSHSTMWSEPLQWIISQLTHRGQPKPPVQT